MAQPMMRWVNVSLSSRLFIVFSVSSVSLCPLCLNKNPSTTFLHDIVARCWTLCSTVGVGMPVTRHPLRRSVRAELPHTALALGRDDADAGVDSGRGGRHAGRAA